MEENKKDEENLKKTEEEIKVEKKPKKSYKVLIVVLIVCAICTLLFIMAIVGIVIKIRANNSRKSKGYSTVQSNISTEYKDISWPNNELVKQLPVPKSLKGIDAYERSDEYRVYIGETSREDYNEYVNACSDNGFNVDYTKKENSYEAKNSKGNILNLKYVEAYNEMYISIKEKEAEKTSTKNTVVTNSVSTSVNNTSTKTETNTTTPTETPKTEKTEKTGLSKEFKAAMDSYEAYMDEYVTFMKKYNSNSSDLSLITQYAEVMKKYTEATKDFEKWGDKDLSKEEEAYYIDVQARVTKKLLEVAG